MTNKIKTTRKRKRAFELKTAEELLIDVKSLGYDTSGFIEEDNTPFISFPDFRDIITPKWIHKKILSISYKQEFDVTSYCSLFGYDYTWFVSRKTGTRLFSKTAAASVYYSLTLISVSSKIHPDIVDREWLRAKMHQYDKKVVAKETNLNESNLGTWSSVNGKREPSHIGNVLLYSYFALKDIFHSKRKVLKVTKADASAVNEYNMNENLNKPTYRVVRELR